MNIEDYKKGDTSNLGYLIDHIYGKNQVAIVFSDKENTVSWETDGVKVNQRKVSKKYCQIRAKIKDEIPLELKSNISTSLAIALHNAFSSEDDDEALSHFTTIENSVDMLLTPAEAKSKLIIHSLWFSLLLSTIFISIFSFWKNPISIIFACSAAGIFGSLFSLLQRNTSYKIDLRSGEFYIFLQAIFIIILGAISGATIYLLVKSNLIFGFASTNVHALLVLSIISGFSERLVPNLFDRIEKTST